MVKITSIKSIALAGLLGLIVGAFTMTLPNYPVKLSIILVCGVLFSALIVFTGFSRYFILFSLIVSFVIFLDYHVINIDNMATFHGLTISILDIFLVLLILRKILFRDQNPNITPDKNNLSIQSKLMAGILLAIFSVSIIGSQNMSLTLFGLIQHVKMVVLFFFIANDVNSENDFKFISYSFTCALALISLYCIAQYVTKINFTISFQVKTRALWYKGGFAPAGPTGSSNITGGQIVTLLPFCLLAVMKSKNHYLRIFAIITTIFGIISLVLTQTRAAWGILGFVFIVFLCLVCWKKLLKVRYVIFILSFLAIIGIVFLMKFLDKMSLNDISDPQNLIARLNLMKTGFRMIEAHPLIGIGLNNYNEVMMEYVPLVFSGEWQYLIHNKYVLIWSETGTLGFIIYLLFIITIYRNIIYFISNQSSNISLIGISILCSLIAFNLHMLFESYAGGAITFQFWFVCGLAVALNSVTNTNLNKSKIKTQTQQFESYLTYE